MATTSNAFGGSGGNPSTSQCPPGEWVTGWSSTTGNYVDSLNITCSEGSALQTVGGSGGTSRAQANCPTGYTSFRLRTGDVLNQLTPLCDQIEQPLGGSGGNAASYTCPQGTLLTGVNTRSSKYIDQIAFTCSPIAKSRLAEALPSKFCPNATGTYLTYSACQQYCTSNHGKCDAAVSSYCAQNPDDTVFCGCYNLQAYDKVKAEFTRNAFAFNPKCNVSACASQYAYKPDDLFNEQCNQQVCIQGMNLDVNTSKLNNVSLTCNNSNNSDKSSNNPTSDSGSGGTGSSVDGTSDSGSGLKDKSISIIIVLAICFLGMLISCGSGFVLL